MKKIIFDDSMGAAGDMIAGVLLDLFDNPEEVVETLNNLIKSAGIEDAVVELAKEFKDDVDGIEFNVTIDGKEEGVDHWDEPDEHDYHHYHEHFDHHPHDHWDHPHEYRKPYHTHDHHFHDHPHDHYHEDHEHFGKCEHRGCRRPRRMGPPFGMPKPMGPSICIEGPIEINLNIDFGKPTKKHGHHHHHHHRRQQKAPKTIARTERKARNRNSKKRALSMKAGKDHLF